MQTHSNSTHPAGTAAEHARRIQYAQAWEAPARPKSSGILLVPLVVLTLLFTLAALAFAATAEPDRRSDWAESKRLMAEQQARAAELRRTRAAQAMCESDHGPHVLAVWVDSTTVQCFNSRGRRLSSPDVSEVLHASR